MTQTIDLVASEAVEKLRELVAASSTCMFASRLTTIPVHVCPMEVQQVDDSGHLWFFSGADSEHNRHVEKDSRVQLIFSNPSRYQYLTVYGDAQIRRDAAKIDELWKKSVETWFPGGKTDPNLTLIRIDPKDVHYWDTRDGKLVSLAKILASSIAGRPADVGIQGDLKL